jgi:murein DD-endopeptidase MepM/ murein hydrolase activator NlpD
MRKLQSVLSISACCSLLAACIPQGTDYRIKSARPSTEPSALPSAPSPQIVPENDVIAATPSWSAANVERNSRQVEGGTYLVEAGDTLYRIVSKTGASLADIASANTLSPPYVLKVGQRIKIPSGLYHNVNAGETGIAIARAYGASWSEIVALNTLEAPFVLNVGQRLRLPASVSAARAAGGAVDAGDTTPEQRALAFSLNIDDIVTGSEPALIGAESKAITNSAIKPALARFDNLVERPASYSGTFRWPLDGQLISRFGSKGGGKVNDGINIAAGIGTPVLAAGDGVVVYSGNEIGVFGGLILVDHGGGWVTAYGHLAQLQVARGDKVKTGQAIGGVGDTGYVDQPQLHFEIRKDRSPIDPILKLSAK